MSDQPPLPNSPEARTPTGELKEPSTLTTNPTTTEAPTDAPSEPPAGPPEKYTDYTVPEGHKLDPGAVESANAVFKELGLNQTQAQKLIDLQVQRDLSMSKERDTAISAQTAAWEAQLKSDPEIGSRLPEVQADIGKALGQLPPKLRAEFQSEMNATGMGNNPALVKALAFFAKSVNEGTHVTGGGPAPSKPNSRPTAASAMYPHLAAQ